MAEFWWGNATKKREKNVGLAENIIGGVTEILKEFEKIIVLEDDIVTSKGFLTYMNSSLNKYAHNEKVMHVSGYMYPVGINLPQTFFIGVPLCWGWATWKHQWQKLNRNAKQLFEIAQSNLFFV